MQKGGGGGGVVLGRGGGLDRGVAVKVISDGAGASGMFQGRGPMMLKGDYSKPLMKLEIWQKDMTIIADFAREVGSPTPLFAATAPIYTAATKAVLGRGPAPVSALLHQMAGGC